VAKIIDTQEILIKCAKIGKVADPAAMKGIYERIAELDDGLPRWDATRLPLRDSRVYGSQAPVTNAVPAADAV
jgi:hypothetical protein